MSISNQENDPAEIYVEQNSHNCPCNHRCNPGLGGRAKRLRLYLRSRYLDWLGLEKAASKGFSSIFQAYKQTPSPGNPPLLAFVTLYLEAGLEAIRTTLRNRESLLLNPGIIAASRAGCTAAAHTFFT